jgi:hypothetical protein
MKSLLFNNYMFMKKIQTFRSSLILFLMITIFNSGYAQLNTQVNAGSDVSICQGSSVQLNAVIGTGSTNGCTATPVIPTVTCTNCNSAISGSGSVNINSGQKVCVLPNTSFTGSINLNGGTLVICGSINPQNVNFNSGNIVVIGTATFNNLNMNNSSSTFKNYGTLTLQNFTFNGTFENHGTATKTNDFNINSGAVFLNTGTFTVSTNFNNNSTATNSGTITVNGSLQNNGSGNFTNNCSMIVNGNFFTGGIFNNNGSLSAGNYSYSWSPATGLNNANIKNPIASPTQTTSYVLKVTGPNGFLKRDTLIVAVNTLSKPDLWYNKHLNICAGEQVKLQAVTAETGVTYQWYKDSVLIPGISTVNYLTGISGGYTVKTVKNGCLSPLSRKITISVGSFCSDKQQTPGYSLNEPIQDTNTNIRSVPPMYVYDRFGDSVKLDDLAIPGNSVVAGVFRLHFFDEDNSTGVGFDVTAPNAANLRATVVQAYRDLSDLLYPKSGFPLANINSVPTPYGGNAQYVELNILAGGLPANAAGGASQYSNERGQELHSEKSGKF